jgi:two-component system chemotaxis response regulator CheB
MPKTRILVVDDAVVMRKLITETLRQDPDLEVVGVAANGKIALQRIPQLNPDLLTLDLEMPEMDGLTTVRELRKTYPKLPVILFSTLSQRGAKITLEALAAGANDYVTKPANIGSVTEAIQRLQEELTPKIKALCRHLVTASASAAQPARFAPAPAALPARAVPIEVVCIGTSTGGPNALATVFQDFPANFPLPIVIVQHMPPMFTAMLAERLTAHSQIPCQEAVEGMLLERGRAYIAPGGRHMEVCRAAEAVRLHLHDGTPENSCRPAVDVLFRSVAAAYGGAVLGVVMTGMGRDGLRGCEAIREHHGQILAQDEATSVVWGMPGYVAQAGLADKVLPLNQIAREITARAGGLPKTPFPTSISKT